VSGVFYYADAGSRNGSLVDGKRIEAKVKIQLKNGTKLRVGSVELIFYVPDEFFKMLKKRGEQTT
jgi:pSer/pThr/pTyr-binding forkhead associated (FHA) protein